jgi:hypothetical protein
MAMRSWTRVGLVCALALAAGGCFEIKQVITLNPDGSGKMALDMLTASPGGMMMGAGKDAAPDANVMAHDAATKLISQSKGVDAWTDVKHEVAKDGRIHVSGTAYFPDLSKMSVGAGEGTEIKWTKDGKDMVLEFVMKEEEEGGKEEPAAKPLSDEEVAKALQEKRDEWAKQKPMVSMFMSTLKMDTTILLPGKIAEVNGFEKVDTTGVRVTIDGKKMLAAMDKVTADDKIMKDGLKAGKDPMKTPAARQALTEAMLGTKGPLRAKVSDLKPLFDYKAEMEKAKAAQPEMMKKLGMDEAPNPKTDEPTLTVPAK